MLNNLYFMWCIMCCTILGCCIIIGTGDGLGTDMWLQDNMLNHNAVAFEWVSFDMLAIVVVSRISSNKLHKLANLNHQLMLNIQQYLAFCVLYGFMNILQQAVQLAQP